MKGMLIKLLNEIKAIEEMENSYIKLKQNKDHIDYADIKKLENLCLEVDKTTLKLEIDYNCGFVESSSMDYYQISKERH